MSKKRYIHRDVSSGNILIVNRKGKLADLEYAQIINTGGHHSVITVHQYVSHFPITHLSRDQLPSWKWRLQAVITVSLLLKQRKTLS